MNFPFDKIIISPDDIDLSFSPLRKNPEISSFVLGTFNPGMTRLPNGNILLMVRIAEALKAPITGNKIHSIRWDSEKGYVLDVFNLIDVDTHDPRIIRLKKYEPMQVDVLTCISWLLPVELSEDGSDILRFHYDKIISPAKSYQEYGIEDARISFVDGKYYMTTCSVSSERQCTTLYTSENGLDYRLEGIILDHQNKDMLFFEGLINNKFHALTRPMGSGYFATPPASTFNPGPSINLAESSDSLHWKPLEEPFIRPIKENNILKVGGGAPPIRTPDGWLLLFHTVKKNGKIGVYETCWALLDKEEPWKIRHIDMKTPVLNSNPDLTKEMTDRIYVEDVVFTTGLISYADVYIVASGELDLCTRITHIPKSFFRI